MAGYYLAKLLNLHKQLYTTETMGSSALDHDFNNFWGLVLGTTELQHRPIANSLMREYWEDPAKAERNYGKILSQYIDKFE